MDVSSFNPKQVMELEMALGVYYTALTVPTQDPKSPFMLKLYSWQDNGKFWKEVYSATLDMTMTYPKLEKTRMIPDRDSLVIYSSIYGNRSWVTLRVLSYWNNDYKFIIKPEVMGNSKVFVENDRVTIETYTGIQRRYSWDGTKVVETTAQRPAPADSPGDVYFRYNTMADGRIELPSDRVTISVGSVLHIVQGQALAKSKGVRLLWDNGPEMEKVLQFQKESLEDHQVYKGLAPGTAVVTIIANGGYDWGNAREVTIEVKER